MSFKNDNNQQLAVAALTVVASSNIDRRLSDVFATMSSEELERFNREQEEALLKLTGEAARPSTGNTLSSQPSLIDLSLSDDDDAKPAASVTRMAQSGLLVDSMASSLVASKEKENITNIKKRKESLAQMKPGKKHLKQTRLSDVMKEHPREELERLNREFERQALQAKEEEVRGPADEEIDFSLFEPKAVHHSYSLQEFEGMIQKAADNHLIDIEVLEKSQGVKRANHHIAKTDSTNQTRAQYGRTLWQGSARLFELGGLVAGKVDDEGKPQVFCDLGHGVGNVVFQAAYTLGCEARGIELVQDRWQISDSLREALDIVHKNQSDLTGEIRHVGEIKLIHDPFEKPEFDENSQFLKPFHLDALTKSVDLLFINNFNGVFACRSNDKAVTLSLDDCVAGLLTKLKVGAKLISLYPLHRLPPSVKDANAMRESKNLPQRDDASYYELEIVQDDGGEEKLGFTEEPFNFYIYTRIGKAKFICANCDAETSEAGEIIDNKLVARVDCPVCKQTARTKRNRQAAKYFKPG